MEGGTLLAGDVEGAARLWETDAVRMAEALPLVAEAVRVEVELHGGTCPPGQPGDSFLAAFERPADAVLAALGIVARLHDAPGVADDDPGLRVRLAVHPDRGPGPSPSGPGRHRACALRDLGHGGQLLVAGSTLDEMGALPPDVDVVDLGCHRLPGPQLAVQVFQVARAGSRASFPELQAARPPGSLPAERTSFVGRRAELASTTESIGRHRIVTLTGSGGSGKTRLAVRAAAEVAGAFPDGVWFCDLSVATGDDRVAGVIAAALSLPDRVGMSQAETIGGHLSRASALLVLDNCEHVIAGAAAVADALIEACPGVRILATSREPLGIRGEVVVAIGSLAVPPLEDDAARVDDYEAVELFVERARAVDPTFVLSGSTRMAVAEICRHLDGMPLALELAAARVAVITPQQIASGLHDRFRTLGHGTRRTVARQMTLAASVQWSYDLLSAEEQRLLRRLSVFAGSFDLPAVVALAQADDASSEDTLNLIDRLVSRSLIETAESPGGKRYRLLETIRQYMGERLRECGEADSARSLHLAYFAEFVKREMRAAARGGAQAAALQNVDAEHDNVAAALGWALERDVAAGIQLVWWLHRFWVTRGRYEEGRRWAAAFDEAAETGGLPPSAGASVLLTLNSMLQYLGDLPGAVAAGKRASAMARDAGDARMEARALTVVGWPQGLLDTAAGISVLEEAEHVARAVGDHLSLVESLLAHAYLAGMRYGVNAFQAILDEGLEAAQASGNEIGGLPLISGVGWNQVLSGDLSAGVAVLEQVLPRLERAGFPYWAGFTLIELAFGHLLAGDIEKAERRCRASIAVGERIASPAMVLTGHLYREAIALRAGRLDELEQAAAHTLDVGSALDGWLAVVYPAMALALRARATVAHAPGSAARDLETALSTVEGHQAPMSVGTIRTAAAAVFRQLGDRESASDQAYRALAELHDAGLICLLPEVLDLIAAIHLDAHDLIAGARLQGAVAALRERTGVRPLLVGLDEASSAQSRDVAGDAEAVAFAEGRELTVDETVAWLLRGRTGRKRPAQGWESLTPAELSVVRLVAAGYTNAEAASRLFMSPRTVSTHLSHVFAKLGVRSRSELAARAVRRGL